VGPEFITKPAGVTSDGGGGDSAGARRAEPSFVQAPKETVIRTVIAPESGYPKWRGHGSTKDAISEQSIGAWRRFFARLLDVMLLGYPLGVLIGIVGANYSVEFAIWIDRPGSEHIIGIVLLPIIFVVEGIIYRLFGTTPGKWMLLVRVLKADGSTPSFLEYFLRLVGVWYYGYGMGIPIVYLMTMAVQAMRLGRVGATTYDENKYKVCGPKLGYFRILCVSILILALIFFQGIISRGS
jgi:uncharacterized RDD family membrane protein YckC